ncbi:hypothetical protein IDJ77_16325 [Mucilaginibacter sp. ZT4R22]|uniref:Uncharacterized protein n=1 Tax=Mucilaginibacter pankratovii TaxID=2772110 RepID=A0ABR7WSV5_9SPHI|nr:hypothetical protein [Mucilaginibacter pankratovii]MBD1365381.1 hypothetical protein [Mucilaginibacter pankratovii]
MTELHFDGWFQVRLATDPDPSDETRGISGMIHVFPGEPDLDRIIRLQPPALQRSYCPAVGVFVRKVITEGKPVSEHPLIGAKVNLANDPVFKGDNGIVAEDGYEPIVPFILEVEKDGFYLNRACTQTPEYLEFPFMALQAKEINGDPAGIRKATNIPDPVKHFAARAASLKADLKKTKDPFSAEVLKRRIAFLTSRSAAAFFDAFMRYEVELGGPSQVKDEKKVFGTTLDETQAWSVEIRFCGWDPDALTGFVQGKLRLP